MDFTKDAWGLPVSVQESLGNCTLRQVDEIVLHEPAQEGFQHLNPISSSGIHRQSIKNIDPSLELLAMPMKSR